MQIYISYNWRLWNKHFLYLFSSCYEADAKFWIHRFRYI